MNLVGVITKGYMYVESSSFLTRNHQIQKYKWKYYIYYSEKI